MKLFIKIPSQIKEVPILYSLKNKKDFPEFDINEIKILIPLLFQAAICDYKMTSKRDTNRYYIELQYINFILQLLDCSVAQANGLILFHKFPLIQTQFVNISRDKIEWFLFFTYCMIVCDGDINDYEAKFIFNALDFLKIEFQDFLNGIKNKENFLNSLSERNKVEYTNFIKYCNDSLSPTDSTTGKICKHTSETIEFKFDIITKSKLEGFVYFGVDNRTSLCCYGEALNGYVSPIISVDVKHLMNNNAELEVSDYQECFSKLLNQVIKEYGRFLHFS